MDSRPCLHGQALRRGNEVGRRWVPASARTTEGRDDGFPPLSSWAGSARGQRRGEEDGSPHPRGQRRGETMDSRPCLHGQALRRGNEVGRRWVPASARTTEGREDGFPLSDHKKGYVLYGGRRVPPQTALRGGNEVGRRWVPASARTTEGRDDGFPPLSSWAGSARGQRSGEEMGPLIREDQRRWREDGFPPPREQRRWARLCARISLGQRS